MSPLVPASCFDGIHIHIYLYIYIHTHIYIYYILCQRCHSPAPPEPSTEPASRRAGFFLWARYPCKGLGFKVYTLAPLVPVSCFVAAPPLGEPAAAPSAADSVLRAAVWVLVGQLVGWLVGWLGGLLVGLLIGPDHHIVSRNSAPPNNACFRV